MKPRCLPTLCFKFEPKDSVPNFFVNNVTRDKDHWPGQCHVGDSLMRIEIFGQGVTLQHCAFLGDAGTIHDSEGRM